MEALLGLVEHPKLDDLSNVRGRLSRLEADFDKIRELIADRGQAIRPASGKEGDRSRRKRELMKKSTCKT